MREIEKEKDREKERGKYKSKNTHICLVILSEQRQIESEYMSIMRQIASVWSDEKNCTNAMSCYMVWFSMTCIEWLCWFALEGAIEWQSGVPVTLINSIQLNTIFIDAQHNLLWPKLYAFPICKFSFKCASIRLKKIKKLRESIMPANDFSKKVIKINKQKWIACAHKIYALDDIKETISTKATNWFFFLIFYEIQYENQNTQFQRDKNEATLDDIHLKRKLLNKII